MAKSVKLSRRQCEIMAQVMMAPGQRGIKIGDMRLLNKIIKEFEDRRLDAGQPPTLVAKDAAVGITPEEQAAHNKAMEEWNKGVEAGRKEVIEFELADTMYGLAKVQLEQFEWHPNFRVEALELGDAFGIS
jgi:hypothetical protein